MFKHMSRAALVLLAAAGLAACTPGGGSGPSPSATAPTSADASPSASPGTPSPDAETTSPAPSPSAAPLTPGPGQGNAELAIAVISSDAAAPANFTLVCQDGVPAAESQHPSASTACTALKENAAILSPAPKAKDTACTQQYGGPQKATVSGMVDGQPVQVNFSLEDGCEIAAWNAAKAVLGSTAGAQ